MTSEPFISVRGEAVLEVEAEIAAVSVTVMAQDKEARRATRLLSERTAQIAGVIRGYGDSVEDLRSHPVHLSVELKEGKPRERIAGYTATGGFSVKISDFSAVGELVARLGSDEMVSVAGPEWLLRPASPVYRQARVAAAQDALQRARDYAGALGGEVAGLVQIADTGMLTDEGDKRPHLMGVRVAAAPAAFDFEPAKQVVRAQIEARFTMTPPTFRGA
jgi:uncharacterized protein YggE